MHRISFPVAPPDHAHAAPRGHGGERLAVLPPYRTGISAAPRPPGPEPRQAVLAHVLDGKPEDR